VQQVRLIADESAAPKLVPLLRDKSPLVVDAAAATMVSIGSGAENSLKKAMAGAEGHAKTAIEHALNQLG
jgi:HEAT repeat protein